jgi:hypothetical protein
MGMAIERYIARAEITWQVVRLNPDGTETVVEVAESEQEAKRSAAKLDKEARRSVL